MGRLITRTGGRFVMACLGFLLLAGLWVGQETVPGLSTPRMGVTSLMVSSTHSDHYAVTASHVSTAVSRSSLSKSVSKSASMAKMGSLGQESDYTVTAKDAQGNPITWDPCKTTLTYRINPAGMTASMRADVQEALARVSVAAGFTFTYLGDSTVVPFAGDGWATPLVKADGDRWVASDADLYIAAAAQGSVPGLGGGTVAIGGGTWSGEQRILGGLVIDRKAAVAPGFGIGLTRGATLMHELGHVLGLGHVDQASQLMNPVLTARSAPVFQRGDLAGFRALRSRGCAQ